MSKVFQNIQVGLDEDLEEKLQWLMPNYAGYQVIKQSLDARRRQAAPHFVYNVMVFEPGESTAPVPLPRDKSYLAVLARRKPTES